MVGGIALLGTVTATLASWLVQRVSVAEKQEASDLRADIERLQLKIDQLVDHIQSRRRHQTPPDPER